MTTNNVSKKILAKFVAVVAVIAIILCVAPVSGLSDILVNASAEAPVYDSSLGSYTTTTDSNGNTVLTAVPNENVGFRGWFLKDGTEVSYNAAYTLPSGASASDYVPVFYNFNLVKKGSFEEYTNNKSLKTGVPEDEIWEGITDGEALGTGSDWTSLTVTNNRARTGAPLSYAISDKGLNTVIDYKNKDSHGRSIPEANLAQLYRLRKWNKRMRVSGAGERNLAFALSEMDRVSSRLGIPRSVREDSAIIYRTAARKKIIRGRSIESVVAAAVYTACRRCDIPRTLDEISEVSNVSKKLIGKTYRFLSRELKIKLAPTSPIDYISRFGSMLEVSGEVQAKAVDIINQSVEKGLSIGKGPTGIAAAALYISSILLGEKKSQKEVSEVAGVTEVTIRNRYKELVEKLDYVI